jgi:hypothetical protein
VQIGLGRPNLAHSLHFKYLSRILFFFHYPRYISPLC